MRKLIAVIPTNICFWFYADQNVFIEDHVECLVHSRQTTTGGLLWAVFFWPEVGGADCIDKRSSFR